jgi:rhodanese-related sulfurtransferase
MHYLFVLLMTLSLSLQAAELHGVNPDELQALQQQGALVVDIRTPEEWKATGIIAGSSTLMYFDKNGGYDREAWLGELKKLVSKPDQPIVLVCRSGNRSGTVGKELAGQAGVGTVYHLEKGLRQWVAESRTLVSVESPKLKGCDKPLTVCSSGPQ